MRPGDVTDTRTPHSRVEIPPVTSTITAAAPSSRTDRSATRASFGRLGIVSISVDQGGEEGPIVAIIQTGSTFSSARRTGPTKAI
jgi:hypothetical protein